MERIGRIGIVSVGCACLLSGCKSAREHREEADEAAYNIVEEKQKAALGRTEPFTIEKPSDTFRRRLLLGQNLPYSHPASLGTHSLEPIKHWPDSDYLEKERAEADRVVDIDAGEPVRIALLDALQIAARNSREYQEQKEGVYRSALGLDLERDEFRATFEGIMDGRIVADYGSGDENIGIGAFPQLGVAQRLKNGMLLSGAIAVDLVKMLTSDRATMGITADASVTMPLLRGAGRHIVTEPLTQSERDVVYAIWRFEQFKRQFVVNIATAYLGVLQQIDRLENAENNYRRVILSARLSRAFADAGRLPEIQVDQAIQQELSARDSWISAQLGLRQQLDQFKVQLGLPPDAEIELDRSALQELAAAAGAVVRQEELPTTQPADPATQPAGPVPVRPGAPTTTQIVATMPAEAEIVLEPPSDEDAGPYELPEPEAIRLAFENRPDLRVAQGQVFDAQRAVVVIADTLRAGLGLTANASAGEGRGIGGDAAGPDGDLRFELGTYSGGLLLDLPFERTAERNAYRTSLIALESAVRSLQSFEDDLKLDVRSDLRQLLNFRESLQTEAKALAVARRRAASTELFFQAGRAEVRDRLEALDALVSAENAFTNALVNYRVAELELQRDLGVLQVNHEGLWQEYDPQASAATTDTANSAERNQ
jgi:outer membrane protein TolC